MHPYWPLFDLEVRTPTLTLRYIDDDLGVQLCDLVQRGIHADGFMPFAVPWTTVASPQRERNTLQHYWELRAQTKPEQWTVELAVLRNGEVIGAGGLGGSNFVTIRSLETGSWLGQAFQGQGYGKEFRAALLHLAFAGFGAAEATTCAWSNNGPSLGVTRSLGYEPNGVRRGMQGDAVGELQLFRLRREHWETIRRDDIEIVNLEPALDVLGLLDVGA